MTLRITIEGPMSSGKTTVLHAIAARLQEVGIHVVCLEEGRPVAVDLARANEGPKPRMVKIITRGKNNGR